MHLFHNYKIINFEHFYDISYGDKVRSTCFIWKCTNCDKTKKDSRYGHVLYPEHMTDFLDKNIILSSLFEKNG